MTIMLLLLLLLLFGGGHEFSILLHFNSLDQYYTIDFIGIATLYNIMSICSLHRTATPATQVESDNPASEHQPITQVAVTDQMSW